MKRIFTIFFGLFFILPITSHAEEEHPHHEEESEQVSSSVGPGKAVVAASAEQGFKLADKGIKLLGIQTVPLSGNPPFKIPEEALVYFQENTGVYRLRAGFFKLIPIKIQQKIGSEITITSDELKRGDSVAHQGIGFLRVVELEAFGGGESGHVH